MKKLKKNIKYLFVILLLSRISYVFSYTMPVAIPNVFDATQIDFTKSMPERPDDWNTEVPGYYYIDLQNGSKSQSYGTEIAPRKYIPSPIPAGSYIEIAGDYNNGKTNGYWIINANGTLSNPVWITQAKNTSGAFTDSRVIFKGENIFVTDISFQNGARPQIGSSSKTTNYDIKNIVIRNSDIAAGIAITGNNIQSSSKNVIIFNNIIHDYGDVDADYDQDSHLMFVGENCSNVWILNNTGYNASGSGLQVNGDSTTTHNIYVGDNEIYNVRQSGLWVKYAKDVIFSSNYVHDIISTSWSPAKGMGAQYEPNGFWMLNNIINGVEYGIRISGTNSTDYTQKAYIIGNIIHNVKSIQSPEWVGGSNTWQSAAIHLVGADEVYIFNNLLFDAPNGIDSSSGNTLTKIKNNIIFDLTSGQEEGTYGRTIWTEFMNAEDDGFEIANNYFDEHMFIQKSGNKYYDLSDLATVGGVDNIKGTALISSDDLELIIKDVSINGYDLSKITDKGTNVDNIITTNFNASFPSISSISLDILGSYRKQGENIDIGPFETGSDESESAEIESSTVTVPNKPSNISVVSP